VWCSDNVAGRINQVTLRPARLILGLVVVTISGTSHPTQLSLLPSAGRKCGDGLRLGSTGSFHMWMNMWVADGPVNTCPVILGLHLECCGLGLDT